MEVGIAVGRKVLKEKVEKLNEIKEPFHHETGKHEMWTNKEGISSQSTDSNVGQEELPGKEVSEPGRQTL